MLVRVLEARGLSIDDIKPVYLSPSALLKGLNSGNVDAGMIWDPLLSAAQIQSGMRMLVDGNGLVANHQFYLASAAFARDNPDVIDVLLKELRHAGEYAAKNAAEMARIMAPEIRVEAQALEVALARLTYGAKPLDENVINGQQKIANMFHALGILHSEISVRQAVWQWV
jgi:sulfonate transport system substrate-binding protein